MNKLKVSVLVFMQEGCSTCESISKELGLENSADVTIAGSLVLKQYNNEKAKEWGFTHVPTTLFLVDDKPAYHEQGFIGKEQFESYITDLQEGKILRTPIK